MVQFLSFLNLTRAYSILSKVQVFLRKPYLGQNEKAESRTALVISCVKPHLTQAAFASRPSRQAHGIEWCMW
jgi:hypothetical protein